MQRSGSRQTRAQRPARAKAARILSKLAIRHAVACGSAVHAPGTAAAHTPALLPLLPQSQDGARPGAAPAPAVGRCR